MEVEKDRIVSGRMFFDDLPKDIRTKIPARCKRIVIDIPSDGPVRILYEVFGTENLVSFITAALRAGYVEDPETAIQEGEVEANDH